MDERSLGACVVGEISGPMGKQVGGGWEITLCTCVVHEETRTHVFGG